MANIVTVKAPIMRAIQAHAEFYPDKTWLYSFDFEGQYSVSNSFKYSNPNFYGGVQHGDDLIYLFDSKVTPNLNLLDTDVAKQMVELWTTFARTGVPRSDYLSSWPTVTSMIYFNNFNFLRTLLALQILNYRYRK